MLFPRHRSCSTPNGKKKKGKGLNSSQVRQGWRQEWARGYSGDTQEICLETVELENPGLTQLIGNGKG